jgi:nucleoside-diphosphate-sugar epimerase
VVQGILCALAKGQPGATYNICGQSLSHNEINAIVSDLAQISHWRLPIPAQAVLLLAHSWTMLSRFTQQEPFYPSNLAHYVFQDWRVSSAKAERELGFSPTPFAEGAKATLEWYWQEGLLKRT